MSFLRYYLDDEDTDNDDINTVNDRWQSNSYMPTSTDAGDTKQDTFGDLTA